MTGLVKSVQFAMDCIVKGLPFIDCFQTRKVGNRTKLLLSSGGGGSKSSMSQTISVETLGLNRLYEEAGLGGGVSCFCLLLW